MRLFATIAVIGAVFAFAAPSALGGTVTGSVDLVDGTPVEGATVVVMDRNGTVATADDTAAGVDVTDAAGDFSITTESSVANGETVTVVEHDAGTAPVSTPVTLTGAAGTVNITPVPSGAAFAALEIYGGQVSRVVAGGDPCEFYLSTSVIPQIFVTVDCGGTWSPVATQTDSSSSGLNGSSAINGGQMAASGVGGEIAALVNGQVQYSRDYGATWNSVQGTIAGASNGRTLFWGHVAGGNDVIVVRDGTSTWSADLSSATPTLITMTSSFVASQYDGIAVGNGATQPYIAIASEASSDSITVTIRPLVAGATPAASSESFSVASGGSGAWTASQPVRVAFGGAPRTNWPNVLMLSVLIGGSDVVKVLSDIDDNGFSSTVTADRTSGGDCGSNAAEMSIGRGFDPRASGGTAGLVIAGACYIAFGATGTSPAFNDTAASGGNNAAIDPGWGTTTFDGTNTSRVLIAPQGDRGIFKAATVSPSLPVWPSLPATDGGADGTAASSDGFAVNGLTVPVTKGMAFGPAGATDIAVMFSPSGGGLCLASDDGLATAAHTKSLVLKGGYDVAWWTGTTGNEWLLCGHGGAGNTLSAFNNWDPTGFTSANGANVASSSSAQHGLDSIYAIEGVSGTNTVWLGGPKSGATSDGRATRVALAGATGSVTLSGITQIGLDDPVTDLVYCPAGSASGFADVLFIATYDSGAGAGGVYRLPDASTASGPVTPALLSGSGTSGAAAVEADCTSGVLWAGMKRPGGGGAAPAIQRSTDGASLATVTLTGIAGSPNVTAMAMNPSNARELLFAADSEGFVYATIDGGTTWTTVNNARQFPGGVNFNSEGIAAMALPPGYTRKAANKIIGPGRVGAQLAAVSSSSTIVGGGSGAYKGSFRSGLSSGSGDSGSGGGSGAAASGGGTSSGGAAAAAAPTTRIAGARWSAAGRTVTATVTVAKPGTVVLTVSLKKGSKLTPVTTGTATIKKAGTASAVFKLKKKLAKGSYVVTIAGGGKTTLVVR